MGKFRVTLEDRKTRTVTEDYEIKATSLRAAQEATDAKYAETEGVTWRVNGLPEKSVTTKKFTVEFEVEAESMATMYGEDFLYVVFDYLGRAVNEVGYERALVRYHNGRNSRNFEIRPGEPATIEEKK